MNTLRVLREPEGADQNEHKLDRDVDGIHRTVVSGGEKRREPGDTDPAPAQRRVVNKGCKAALDKRIVPIR